MKTTQVLSVAFVLQLRRLQPVIDEMNVGSLTLIFTSLAVHRLFRSLGKSFSMSFMAAAHLFLFSEIIDSIQALARTGGADEFL